MRRKKTGWWNQKVKEEVAKKKDYGRKIIMDKVIKLGKVQDKKENSEEGSSEF